MSGQSSAGLRWCVICARKVPTHRGGKYERGKFSLLFLTLITCGLFLPFALLGLAVNHDKYTCPHCTGPSVPYDSEFERLT